LVLLLCATRVPAQLIAYKGGLISTRAPAPVGGDYVMVVNTITSTFIATTSVDGNVIDGFYGVYDSRGKLRGVSSRGTLPITGQFKFKNGYLTFVGRILAPNAAYKVQATVGVFP
jgi:hypothetical protein